MNTLRVSWFQVESFSVGSKLWNQIKLSSTSQTLQEVEQTESSKAVRGDDWRVVGRHHFRIHVKLENDEPVA